MATLLCVGDLNLDLVITPETDVVVGADTPGTVAMSGGGSAANAAAWAADAGIAVRFVGTVGDDETGAYLVDELSRRGVHVVPLVRRDARSRTIAAIIDRQGERSMVSDLDPRVALTEGDDDPNWFTGVDWVHLTAYTYVGPHSRPLFDRLTRRATEVGLAWSVDPSSHELLRRVGTPAEALAAFAGASVLFPNHDEAAWLTGEHDPATAAAVLARFAPTVVVKCGADGAWVTNQHLAPTHVPAASVAVVNTLGCGDAFAGGFLAGRLLGEDDLAAATRGTHTAGRAVGRPGAR